VPHSIRALVSAKETTGLDANRARLVARLGGVLYLIIIAVGALGEAVVRGSIIVPGNATATAANLRSMEWLWRLGIAGEVVLLVCATALALILYVLLRGVNRDLALAAVFFNLMCIAIEGVAAISLAAALFPLSSATYLSAFAPEQVNAMAMLAVRSHTTGFSIALIFLRGRVRHTRLFDLSISLHAEADRCSHADRRRLLSHQQLCAHTVAAALEPAFSSDRHSGVYRRTVARAMAYREGS
jgi:signal transduction histidine kinase